MIFGSEEAVQYEDPETVKRKRAIAEYGQLQGMPIGGDLRAALEQQIIHGNNRAATQAGSALATIQEGHPGVTNAGMRDAMIAQLVGQGQQMDAQQAAQQEAQRQAGHQRFLEQSARTPVAVGGMINGQSVVAPGAGHLAQFNGAMTGMGLNPEAQQIDPRAMLQAQIEATHRTPEYQLGAQRNAGQIAHQTLQNQGTERVAQIGAEAHKYMADSTAAGRVAAAKGTEAADRARLGKLQYQASRTAERTMRDGHKEYVSALHELEGRLSNGNKNLLTQPDTQQKLREALRAQGLDYSVVGGVVTPLDDKGWGVSSAGRRHLEAASFSSDDPAFQDAFYGAVKARTGQDLSPAAVAEREAKLGGVSADEWKLPAQPGAQSGQQASALQSLQMQPAERALLQEALQLLPAAKAGNKDAMAKLEQLKQQHKKVGSATPPAHQAASQRRIYNENAKGGGGGDAGGDSSSLQAGASASIAPAAGRGYGLLNAPAPHYRPAHEAEAERLRGLPVPEWLYYRNAPPERNPAYVPPRRTR